MIDNELKENDLAIAYIGYEDKPDGKRRPVFIYNLDDDIQVLRITTKYHNKPQKYQNQLYEIREWDKCGLDHPSWIDVSSVHNLSKKDFSVKKLGTLTREDKKGLGQFIDNYTEKETQKLIDQQKNLAYLRYLKKHGLDR